MLLWLALLSGCNNYSVTVNENLVYTPPSLFKNYRIADDNLRGCVEKTIEEARVTKAEELKRLNCSSAGITSLAGLERFYGLEELNLPGNRLTRVPELAQLSRLRLLILRDNALESAEPLLTLLRLTHLDLAENPNLDCAQVQQLAGNLDETGGSIIVPEQCEA